MSGADVVAVYVVRHGVTGANVAGELVGRRDVPLSSEGERQVAALARFLGEVVGGPALVVSSPLRRAVDTAAAVAGALGVGVAEDDRLVELDYGDLEGTQFGALLASWPPEWAADPDVACPGGESYGALEERLRSALADHVVAARSAGAGSVVLATHSGPAKVAVKIAIDGPPDTVTRVHVAPASVTVLQAEAARYRLEAVNLSPPA